MIEAVIFDMDDTLFAELDYCQSGFKAVARYLSEKFDNLSSDEVFDVFWKIFSAGNHKTVFNQALEQLGIEYDLNFIQNLIHAYRNHHPDIALPGDSEQILELLQPKYKLALITDGFMPAQKLKVQALGIEKYFQYIVYTEELGREHWKPSPLPYKKVVEQLNVNPQNCACVADNLTKDFISPNMMKMKTIRMIRPNAIKERHAPHETAEPMFTIKSFNELTDLLSKL